MQPVVCVDFGSTFTKAALVDRDAGVLLATAQHPTTLPALDPGADLLDGLDACLATLGPEAEGAPVLACSSAGGGLRIGVVGTEELVTAEAGRRVAMSSGGRVVAVLAGGLDATGLDGLGEADVVLLTGGTDGGNSEVLLHDARALADAGWSGPVVVAGDTEARDEVAAILTASGTPYVLADNVVPRIGVLAPESARLAIREVFLRHVIGGKHLSRRADLGTMLLGATPDVVLAGVEVLAAELLAEGEGSPGHGVVVVDIGGATTDVHSVITLDPEEATLAREVVAAAPVTRTVEGDLGMRWSAVSTAEAAVEAGLGGSDLLAAAGRRASDPAYLPEEAAEIEADHALAVAATVLAVRRHAGRARVVLADDGRVVERTGKDLRQADLLVGSGGVLRAAGGERADAILGAATGVSPDGWQLPEAPRVVVDERYVLAAIGLLALSEGAGGDTPAARLACTSLAEWQGR